MLSRIGSGLSPQNSQLTSITSSAGRLPNPARAPKPPAANTALSRSVRNLSHTYSVIVAAPSDSGQVNRRQAMLPALRLHEALHPRRHRARVEVVHDEGPQ